MEPPIQASELHSKFKAIQPKEIQQSDSSDVDYYELSTTQGWKRLKEFIESQIQLLDSNPGIDETDTIETIGFKFLATKTAKAYLAQVLNVVEASSEYIKQRAEESNSNK